jgi:hypothetical protein
MPEGAAAGAALAGAGAATEEAAGLPIPPNKPKLEGAAAGEAEVAAPLDAPALDAEGAPPSKPPDGAGLKSDTPGAPDDGCPDVGNNGLVVLAAGLLNMLPELLGAGAVVVG